MVFSLTCLASLCIYSTSFGNDLTGKLEKLGMFGILPASYKNVSLCKENGDIIKTEVTNSDGIYLFRDVEPGVYLLKIWAKGFKYDPLSQKVEISRDLDPTEANTIPIHKFTLESPKEQAFPETLMSQREGIRFVAQGSHYALPEEGKIWPILKCTNGNYLISTEKPVKINKDGKWMSREIWVDRPVEEILAVLVTKKGDNYFRWRISSNNREFIELPENSYVLAKRRIISY